MDGNGVSTTLAIDFPFHSVEDLIVIETIIATGAETTKVLNTDYTVGGAQDDAGHFPDGGEITFTTPPASSVRVVAYRDPPMSQGVVLQETGKIPVKAAIESPLDKLTMIDQRLSERIDRALRLSDGDSLEMGRLPVKGVRASRYLGFDGDGNPTMMQTPTGVVTSLAQLTESLKAALPAAGAAGSLRKVTDDARGVWMDTGTRWAPLNGGVINALEFVSGDGTDESAGLQALLDTGKDIFFGPPPVAYGVGSGLILSTSYQRLYGVGPRSVFKCLAADFNLFTPSADLVGIEIDGIRAYGFATTDATQQYFLYTTTSSTVQRSKFCRLWITGPNASTGFNNGLLFDTDSDANLIEHCLFERLIGTSPGHGYGVLLSNAGHNIVAYNRFLGAVGQGRHAVYISSGASNTLVVGNFVSNYQNIPLVIYALSSQATCVFNRIESNLIEGGTVASDDQGAIHAEGNVQDNTISNNLITGWGRYGILITDGAQGGLCARNRVLGNLVHEVGYSGIYLLGTKNTLVQGNQVYDASQGSAGTYSGINVSSSGAFGTEENVGSTVVGNKSFGATQRAGLGIDSGAPVPSGFVIHGNDLGAGVVTTYSYKGAAYLGDTVARASVAVAAHVAVQAAGHLRTTLVITGTDATNMTIDDPTDARTDKELLITIQNNSGGALGTCTFASGYKTTGSWTQPANAKSRSILFVYNGSVWIEHFRSAADVNI